MFREKNPIKTPSDLLYELYWKQNMTTPDIASLLGIPCSTVLYRMEKLGIARRKGGFKKGHKPWCAGKHWYKIKPNLTPSPELAYLLGVRYGDGRLMRNEKKSEFSFGLHAKDRDFVEEFKRCADAVKGRCGGKIWREKGGYYGYKVYSKALYDFLNKPIQAHEGIIKKFPQHFLRGFFDSEGCVSYGNPNGKRSKETQIGASNTDLQLLKFCQHLLAEFFHINSHIYLSQQEGKVYRIVNKLAQRQKALYVLVIKDNDSKIKFAKHIGFTIKRKQTKLVRGLPCYQAQG
jgi:intein-encoded DNA endonuclease-like protein